jgi:hypothetical protein
VVVAACRELQQLITNLDVDDFLIAKRIVPESEVFVQTARLDDAYVVEYRDGSP